MVAFLEKSTGSDGFHQVIDFLTRSHICYALTKKPDVCVSFIKQFWRSAEVTTADNGEVKIIATIDGHSMTITEASLRRHLKLDDQDGVTSIPNSEIFEQLALMGYHTDSDKLTFQKGAFSPQWRITSSPSHSPKHSPSPTPSPSPEPTPDHTTADITQPLPIQPSPTLPSSGVEHHFPTPHDSPLHAVYSYGSDEGSLKLNALMNLVTKLSDRIGGQEARESQITIGNHGAQTRVVLSNDEDIADDSSKQGRKLSDAEKAVEKGSVEVSTAGAKQGTACEEVPIVSIAEVILSTAGGTITYTRRSEEKRSRQDKGKAIMIESEPKRTSKKELKQDRIKFLLIGGMKPSELKEPINECRNKELKLQEMRRLLDSGMKKKGKELWMKLSLLRR
ncbi:hypothetical protein Tco_0026735 [Tanacetum coccineum]